MILSSRRHPGSGLVLLLALLSFTASGCVCAFQRDWREATRNGLPTDNLAGLWEGTWESGYNGHRGTLRAIITPCGNGEYRAQYFATFAGCIPCAYETTYSATYQDGVTHFSGQQDLGKLAGGVYHTTGWANGQTFRADFQADKDFGTYQMTRVSSDADCADSCAATLGCGTTGTASWTSE